MIWPIRSSVCKSFRYVPDKQYRYRWIKSIPLNGVRTTKHPRLKELLFFVEVAARVCTKNLSPFRYFHKIEDSWDLIWVFVIYTWRWDISCQVPWRLAYISDPLIQLVLFKSWIFCQPSCRKQNGQELFPPKSNDRHEGRRFMSSLKEFKEMKALKGLNKLKSSEAHRVRLVSRMINTLMKIVPKVSGCLPCGRTCLMHRAITGVTTRGRVGTLVVTSKRIN